MVPTRPFTSAPGPFTSPPWTVHIPTWTVHLLSWLVHLPPAQGQPPEGALRLRDKQLDGGSVPLGTPQTLSASLKNGGTRAAAFRVLPNSLLKVIYMPPCTQPHTHKTRACFTHKHSVCQQPVA